MPANQVPPEKKVVPLPPPSTREAANGNVPGLDFMGADQVTGESSQEQAARHQYKDILFKGIEQDIKERKNYASKVYYLVCGWLGFIALILLFQGFKPGGFVLDSEVLKWAIVTMGLNVLGLLFAVIRYLFDRGGKIPLPDPSAEISSLFPVPGVEPKGNKRK